MIVIGCDVAPLCSGCAHDYIVHMFFSVSGRNMAKRLIIDGRECHIVENQKLLPRAFARVRVAGLGHCIFSIICPVVSG